jgi:hypothetical protein
MVARNVFFCHENESIKHLFFQWCFTRSIWSVIQVALTLFPPCSVTNIFRNWLNGIDYRVKRHIRWERFLLFGRFGYVEMIKCLTRKTILFCRLSTGVYIHSVYGRLYRGWRIETYLWRSVHDWRLRREILFLNIGGCIVYALDLLFRRFTIAPYDMQFPFFHLVGLDMDY